ncbi:hypothetical protein HHI36_008495 [Cryptolaemus montrouzieri]|uniref:Lipase domain-containing protein n=1 Tax=Cryptolaemus montrouzieri TaxID=559131 RepID=A0ABD2MSN2_9CUCU
MELVDLLGEMIQMRDGDVQEGDVRLFLFTRMNPLDPVKLQLNHTNQFDTSKPTKFIIHGYLENHLVDWYKIMKDELLKNNDMNVIEVDWKRVSRSLYTSSAKNIKLIGIILGRFILDNGILLDRLHMIGHSLGAHLAGFASKYVKQNTSSTIGRISALDPAGPYFRYFGITSRERLSRDDAEIVDVIHTDGGVFGLDEPVGTLDMYFNDGRRRQPGCHDGELGSDIPTLLTNILCSHRRSLDYFIQSINNANITCRRCLSYKSLRHHACSSTDIYTIMQENITEKMTGICAAYTSPTPPYF